MMNQTAEQKIQKIVSKAGQPLQAYQIIKQMNWKYSSDAAHVIQDMANSGQLTRTWDNQGNVYYTK